MQKSAVDKISSVVRNLLVDMNRISSDYVRTEDLEDWQRTVTDFIFQSLDMMEITLKQMGDK